MKRNCPLNWQRVLAEYQCLSYSLFKVVFMCLLSGNKLYFNTANKNLTCYQLKWKCDLCSCKQNQVQRVPSADGSERRWRLPPAWRRPRRMDHTGWGGEECQTSFIHCWKVMSSTSEDVCFYLLVRMSLSQSDGGKKVFLLLQFMKSSQKPETGVTYVVHKSERKGPETGRPLMSKCSFFKVWRWLKNMWNWEVTLMLDASLLQHELTAPTSPLTLQHKLHVRTKPGSDGLSEASCWVASRLSLLASKLMLDNIRENSFTWWTTVTAVIDAQVYSCPTAYRAGRSVDDLFWLMLANISSWQQQVWLMMFFLSSGWAALNTDLQSGVKLLERPFFLCWILHVFFIPRGVANTVNLQLLGLLLSAGGPGPSDWMKTQ